MKKILIRLLKITLSLAALFIVVLAVVASVSRVFFSSLDKYKPQVEALASEITHQPVQIGQLTGYWRGLAPVFTLDKVIVWNDAKTIKMIKVERIQISPNLFKSLIYWRFEPGLIKVNGTRLVIHQLGDNNYDVNGIQSHYEQPKKNNNDVEEVLAWIVEQGKISVSNVDIDWYGKNGLHLPIVNLNLLLSRGFIHHRLFGAATLNQAMPTHFRFVMNLHGDVLDPQQLHVDFYFHVKNLDMAQWLKGQNFHGVHITGGQLNDLQLWGNWHNRRLQQVQTNFNATNLNFNPIKHAISSSTPSLLNRTLLVEKLAANLLWQRDKDRWILAGNKLQLSINREVWPVDAFSFEVIPGDNTAQQNLYINILNFRQLSQLMQSINWLPNAFKIVLLNLQPTGELTDIKLQHEGDNFANQQYRLLAKFNNVNTKAWRDLPGVNNVTGEVDMRPDEGQVQLKGKQLTLNYTKLFRLIYKRSPRVMAVKLTLPKWRLS